LIFNKGKQPRKIPQKVSLVFSFFPKPAETILKATGETTACDNQRLFDGKQPWLVSVLCAKQVRIKPEFTHGLGKLTNLAFD
jgi:hypothetical protein